MLRRIRAERRTRIVPVVVLTSSKQQEDILDSYQSGANTYVRKPVNFTEFSDAVSTLGMFWLLLNEPAPRLHAGIGLRGDVHERWESKQQTADWYAGRRRRSGAGEYPARGPGRPGGTEEHASSSWRTKPGMLNSPSAC